MKSVKTEYSEPILCDDCKKKRESTAGSVSDSAPSCDSDTENDFFEQDIMKRDYFNDINEPEFIVFWSCLLSLFGFCFTCLSKSFIDKVSVRGTLLYVKTIWKNNHVFEWKSQPKLKNISIGNILLSSSILYSGNTFGQIYEMFKMINTAYISKARFFEIQKMLLFPVVNRFCKMLKDEIYEGCSNAVANHFSGDGRCDSPGYSAKYGTYSLMNQHDN